MQYSILIALHLSSFKISNLGSDSTLVCAKQVVVAVCSRFLFDMYPFRISAALLVIQPENCHDFSLYLHIKYCLHMSSYLNFQIFGFGICIVLLIGILYFFISEHQIVRFKVGTAMNIQITVFLTMAV